MMTPFTRLSRRSVLALATLPLLPAAAMAQASAYPRKTVRIVLPYPPGGPTDIVARLVAQKLTESLQQSFVVENRPGATGMMGTDAVAKAAPDGYTLLVNASVHVLYPSLFPTLQFDPVKDFAPVGLLARGPLALVVNPELPARSVPELVALARSRRDGLTFGSSGNGGATHLAAEAFRIATGANLRHVAYKGSAPALADIAAGHVDLMFDSLASSGAFVRSGKLRALAVTSAKRSPALPDVPAVGESVNGYDLTTWYGLWAPAGVPAQVVALLSEHVGHALRSAELQARLTTLGLEPAPGTAQEFTTFQLHEQKKWGEIVRKAGVKPL